MFVTQTTDKPSTSPIETLGGKGFNLFRMVNAGLPVPPAFVIPTQACVKYMEDPVGVMAYVAKTVVPAIIKYHGFKAGELVSVRSGAKVSMPGMMDTILNVGITQESFQILRELKGERTALDSARRLIQMFGNVVKDIPHERFENILRDARKQAGVLTDAEFNVAQLVEITDAFRQVYAQATTYEFPDTLEEQLLLAIEAVFKSWNNERAIFYREQNGIPHNWGTAVVVQRMVFGNANDKSCTGVLFTRDPSSGKKGIIGEFLVNAQGEDVVAGIRTPDPLSQMAKWNEPVYSELLACATLMEETNRDMQDMEFTVENGKLYFLQTRNGKRMATAAIQIAYDMVIEKKLTPEEALKRVSYKQFVSACRPQIDPKFTAKEHGVGLPASVGIAKGVAVFSSKAAVDSKVPCILVSEETTPDDIKGMFAAEGILTSTGGATSHAAVVARGMDKVCVVGCDALQIHDKTVTLGSKTLVEGKSVLCIDGGTGRVWVDTDVPVVGGENSPTIMALAELVQQVETVQMIVPLSVAATKMPSGIAGMVYIEDNDLTDGCKAQVDKALKNGWNKYVVQARDRLFPTNLNARFYSADTELDITVKLGPLLDTAGVTIFVDHPSKSLVAKLSTYKAAIFSLSGEAVSLEGLLMAPSGTEVVMPKNVTPAVKKLLELREAAGDKLTAVSVGNLVKSAKSYVGIPALMQLVLQ